MSSAMTTDPVTITSFDFENVKRIKAVALTPAAAGLTVIGGRNSQGKTSVLDAICWALGGNSYKPDKPHRDGSMMDPDLHVELSNGIVVERKGQSGTLKVTDAEGKKAGQTLLNSFVEQFALDLPRFLQASDKEKALTLLRILGIEEQLSEFDKQEQILVNKRLNTGQIERQRRGAAETLPWYPDAPLDPLDIADLAEQQREALEFNAEIQRKRDAIASQEQLVIRLQADVESAKIHLERKSADLNYAVEHLNTLRSQEIGLPVDTDEIAQAISDAQETNRKVEQNRLRIAALGEADQLKEEYKALDDEITELRNKRLSLLNGVEMPLPGLTVIDGVLVYKNATWGDMSGSEQMKVATAIVRKLNPACGFVLVDKLEQFDTFTLAEFAQWCESEHLQVIGTRVSTGDECSVIIEDGMIGIPEPNHQKVAASNANQPVLALATGEPEPWPVEFAPAGIQPAGAVMPEYPITTAERMS